MLRFHFTHCCYFLGHVACRNLPWQGLYTPTWLYGYVVMQVGANIINVGMRLHAYYTFYLLPCSHCFRVLYKEGWKLSLTKVNGTLILIN